MNFIDIIFVLFFIATLYGGYKRGLLQELYDLGEIIVTVVISFLLKDLAAKYIVNAIDFRTLLKLNIPKDVYDITLSFVSTTIGFTIVFLVVTIILKLVITISMKNGLIPSRTDNYNFGGSIISGLKTILFFTVVAFILSFSPLINKPQIYEGSVLLKPLLQLNQPLYNARTELVKIIEDTRSLTQAISKEGELTNTKEIVTILKDIKSNALITDDMIASTSKAFIKNKEPIALTEEQVDTFKVNIKADEKFPLLQSLYDEKIVTEELIVKVLEANDITGITKEDITDIFKKGE